MSNLSAEIVQYENQLSQIQLAISASPDGPEKENLLTLEADIKELISLTKQTQGSCDAEEKDELSSEYELFKAEMAKLDAENDKASPSLEDELNALEGMKCQAPHLYAWQETQSYHNALVFQVDKTSMATCDDVRVRVMFTNPTHKDMLPCPYYLQGECKFTDDRCRYSHGEWVALNSLKEFREPNFVKLGPGSRVLAKQNDNLWHRAVIIEVDGENCKVKLESSSKIEECHLQNIFPLDESSGDAKEDASGSESEEDSMEEANMEEEREEAVRRVLCAPPTSSLGEWEQFTKGFGSRIMAKLGYVVGDGLGIRGNGRVEPVPAIIMPAGKSLDHCMMLRENAGGDPDLFKAEKRFKRKQKKHEESLQRAYEREKKKTDVFTFLNNKIGQSTSGIDTKKSGPSKMELDKKLKAESSRTLNVTSLQLGQEVKRAQKEIRSLNESLARHSSGTPAFDAIKEKLTSKELHLSQLQASERRISQEQEQRRDRKKLAVF